MDAIKDVVQQKYGEAALRARSGQKAACGCGTSGCCGTDPITSDLYDEAQAAAIPAEAMLASLGCGNPTALAELQARRSRARSRLRRRHRRAAVGEACRPDRKGLRPGHDRRDARPRARESGRSPE